MEKIKDLQYYKENAEENYLTTPISVLRYITELEQALQLQQTGVSGRSEQLSCFLYQDERGIFTGYHGDTNVTEEWNDYLKTR